MRATFEKLLKAKQALQLTLRRILDINKKKKQLTYIKSTPSRTGELKEELRLLNRVAHQQAKLIALYESELHQKKTG